MNCFIWTDSLKMTQWEESCISKAEQGLNQSQLEITCCTTALLFWISSEHWETWRLQMMKEWAGKQPQPARSSLSSYSVPYHLKLKTSSDANFCGNIKPWFSKALGNALIPKYTDESRYWIEQIYLGDLYNILSYILCFP